MGVILMKMAVLLQGNAFCVDGHRGVAGFPEDPILSTQRIPRSGDPIVSTQRIPRGRDRIFPTQRIFPKRYILWICMSSFRQKNDEKYMVYLKIFRALRALICSPIQRIIFSLIRKIMKN